jgi:hypothetical protein
MSGREAIIKPDHSFTFHINITKALQYILAHFSHTSFAIEYIQSFIQTTENNIIQYQYTRSHNHTAG